MSVAGKKILFISVSFFDYEKEIIRKLEKQGAEVYFYDDRPSNSNIIKGIVRIFPSLLGFKIKKYYQHIFSEIKNKNFDYFLLIKGEAIPIQFIQKIKAQNPNMKTICYTFDSIEEHPRFLKLLPYFDEKFTFDDLDANQYQLKFRPLFFVDTYLKNNQNIEKKYDLLFIGSAHTDRYLIGKKIKTTLDNLGLHSFFYYYSPSKMAFWMKRFFDKNFKKCNINEVSFHKLSHQEITQLYQKTTSILDINKPYQNGLTMRTFEALAFGKKLITTNENISKYPFYNPKNIRIINRDQPIVNSCFFDVPFVEYHEEIIQKMSLDSWVDCLFSKDQNEYWKL